MARSVGGQHMIVRDVSGALARSFDLVIIGGGIYGASLLYEAARRGLSACLCEANDFGSGTSWNSLRIVHGGLRYLQGLDLKRFYQHIQSRRRIARRLPQLVRVLPCVMPLYGQGLLRPSIMRGALLANDVLSTGRNRGLQQRVAIPSGAVLDSETTRREFPYVRSEGLKGAALWSDYFMISSERILIELLRNACRHGALALNYTRVEGLSESGGRVSGVCVKDLHTGVSGTIRASKVINCTGPWVGWIDAGTRAGLPTPVFHPSLAFNLLIDLKLKSTAALAVAAPTRGSQMLFLVPQKRTVLAGTLHLPRPPGTTVAKPEPHEVEQYLSQLRAALPGCEVSQAHVTRVFAGLLPAEQANSAALAKREILFDHGAQGGLAGLYTVAGVKFTAASEVAEAALQLSGLGRQAEDTQEVDANLPTSTATPLVTDATRFLQADPAEARDALLTVMREEAVLSIDDLVQRRTNWATSDENLDEIRGRVVQLIGARLEDSGQRDTHTSEMRSAR
jgi:glycerol-3-phosphate dehydrogenase